VRGEVENLCCSEREEDSLPGDAAGLAVDRRHAALPSLDGTPRGGAKDSLLRLALDYVGVPYRWGDATKGGVDCSGLIVRAAADLGQRLPHSAARLYDLGEPVAKGTLRPGDLVFFADTYRPGVSHVGIYEGGTSFVHASSSAGRVTLGDLDDPYFQSKYAGAGRLPLSGDRAEPAPDPQPLHRDRVIADMRVGDLRAPGRDRLQPGES
jgi:cell wall-associated NlpC family hydrolase